MEDIWLGCLKGILLGALTDDQEAKTLSYTVASVNEKCFHGLLKPVDLQMLEVSQNISGAKGLLVCASYCSNNNLCKSQ